MSEQTEDNQVPECLICQEILYLPVTLPCEHIYCRECIIQALKVKPLCITCRNPVTGNPENLSINFTLQKMIESNYKQQYEQKKDEMETKINIQQNSQKDNRNSNSGSQNTPQYILENVLVLQQCKTKYLFPHTTVDVSLMYQDSLEQLLLQSSDKKVIIYFTRNAQQIASYCQILQIYNQNAKQSKSDLNCEVKVLSRVQIIDLKEIKINYNESLSQEQTTLLEQSHQQINQSNSDQLSNNNPTRIVNEKNNIRLFKDGFTFKVAKANVIQNKAVTIDKETKIQDRIAELQKQIKSKTQHYYLFDEPPIELNSILEKQNLLFYLRNKNINNMTRAQEFCWIVCGVFNFTQSERDLLWDTDSFMKRLALLQKFIRKFKNNSSIFDIEQTKRSYNILFITYGIIIAFMLFIYFYQIK